MRHVIIGNSAAGVFAAEAIRRTRPTDTIIILTDEDVPAYSRCLTSYFIAGRVAEEEMTLRSPDFYQRYSINVYYSCRVEGVDTSAARVYCTGGKTVDYDRLLVASGARPVIPNVPGIGARGVHGLRTLQDARAISSRAVPGTPAVVIGGGLVSLKAASSLLERRLQVTVVVSSSHILSQVLDGAAAAMLQRRLEENGMRFLLQQDVAEVVSSGGEVTGVVLTSGARLPACLVVVGKGVTPNINFLRDTPIVINRGVLVNEYLESSVTGVYAAGDVAEAHDLLLKEPAINAVWPNATTQGELAGLNMAGEQRTYRGSIAMNSLDFFGLSAITAGLNRAEGDRYEVHAWHNAARNHYRKLVFEGDRLVGYTLAGDTRQAGALTSLILGEVRLGSRKEALIAGDRVLMVPYQTSFLPASTAVRI
ncbi:MAG: FAD-dependent oxidoreductase [Bacillota bacterium]